MSFVCISGRLKTKPFETFEEADNYRKAWGGKFSIFERIKIEEVEA